MAKKISKTKKFSGKTTNLIVIGLIALLIGSYLLVPAVKNTFNKGAENIYDFVTGQSEPRKVTEKEMPGKQPAEDKVLEKKVGQELKEASVRVWADPDKFNPFTGEKAEIHFVSKTKLKGLSVVIVDSKGNHFLTLFESFSLNANEHTSVYWDGTGKDKKTFVQPGDYEVELLKWPMAVGETAKVTLLGPEEAGDADKQAVKEVILNQEKAGVKPTNDNKWFESIELAVSPAKPVAEITLDFKNPNDTYPKDIGTILPLNDEVIINGVKQKNVQDKTLAIGLSDPEGDNLDLGKMPFKMTITADYTEFFKANKITLPTEKEKTIQLDFGINGKSPETKIKIKLNEPGIGLMAAGTGLEEMANIMTDEKGWQLVSVIDPGIEHRKEFIQSIKKKIQDEYSSLEKEFPNYKLKYVWIFGDDSEIPAYDGDDYGVEVDKKKKEFKFTLPSNFKAPEVLPDIALKQIYKNINLKETDFQEQLFVGPLDSTYYANVDGDFYKELIVARLPVTYLGDLIRFYKLSKEMRPAGGYALFYRDEPSEDEKGRQAFKLGEYPLKYAYTGLFPKIYLPDEAEELGYDKLIGNKATQLTVFADPPKEKINTALGNAGYFEINAHGSEGSCNLNAAFGGGKDSYTIEDMQLLQNSPLIMAESCKTAKELGPGFLARGAQYIGCAYACSGIFEYVPLGSGTIGESYQNYLNKLSISPEFYELYPFEYLKNFRVLYGDPTAKMPNFKIDTAKIPVFSFSGNKLEVMMPPLKLDELMENNSIFTDAEIENIKNGKYKFVEGSRDNDFSFTAGQNDSYYNLIYKDIDEPIKGIIIPYVILQTDEGRIEELGISDELEEKIKELHPELGYDYAVVMPSKSINNGFGLAILDSLTFFDNGNTLIPTSVSGLSDKDTSKLADFMDVGRIKELYVEIGNAKIAPYSSSSYFIEPSTPLGDNGKENGSELLYAIMAPALVELIKNDAMEKPWKIVVEFENQAEPTK